VEWLVSPGGSGPYLVFAIAAIGVGWAGSALAARADSLAERTGIGRFLAGALLLGVTTSLPELATTVSAASRGAGALAGNNLLGAISLQIALLALVDMLALQRRALTSFSPHAGLLLHAVFLILLLALATLALVAPDVAIGGRVSPWSIGLAGVYASTLYYLHRYEGNPRWEPRGEVKQPPQSAKDMKDAIAAEHARTSLPRLWAQFGAFALVVLVAGHGVAVSAESIAERTGLGETLVGATLVAFTTSLPEISTTFSAVRMGAYSMAVSNVLGTNALLVALFLPVDLAYSDGTIFAALEPSSTLLGLLGITLAAIYLWGVLERRDRTLMSLGVDSFFVLMTYVAGLTLLGTME